MVTRGVLPSLLVLEVLFLMILTGVVALGGKNGQADRPSSSSSRGRSNVSVSTDEERKFPGCFLSLLGQKKKPNESTSKESGWKLSFGSSKKKLRSTYSGGKILNPSSPNSMPSHRDPYTGLLKD